jgi:hypothetical protein
LTTELLFPIAEVNPDYEQLMNYTKGLSDTYAAIKSKKATAFKKVVTTLKPDFSSNMPSGFNLPDLLVVVTLSEVINKKRIYTN